MNRFFFVIFFILISFISPSKGTASFLPEKFEIIFTKSLQSIFKKKKKSKGILSYQYPGKIRMEQSKPFKTMYVSNGKKAWLYSESFNLKKEKAQVMLLGSRKLPLVRVFDQLRKGLGSNKIYQVSRKGKSIFLTFNKAASERYGVTSMEVKMKTPYGQSLLEMESLVVKTKNMVENYEVVRVNTAPSFTLKHFNFEVTDKMKVVENF